VTIHALFGMGLLIGGIRAINPPDQAIWTYTQFLSGWPMIIANRAEKNSQIELTALATQFERETPAGETSP